MAEQSTMRSKEARLESMDPLWPSHQDPIERIERQLRHLVHDLLTRQFGPEWASDPAIGLGPEWWAELQEKARADHGAQPNVVVSELPIAYAEFSDLGKLVEKHWPLFMPVFHDTRFWTYYSDAERLRNIVKHHRDITPAQAALLVGIAGELEDVITVWRVGAPFRTVRTVLQFANLVQTSERTSAEIVEDQMQRVREWRDGFLLATHAVELDTRAIHIDESPTSVRLKVQHTQLTISGFGVAAPNHRIDGVDYRDVGVELVHGAAARLDLGRLVTALGKPYRHLVHELDRTIDLQMLRRWSTERAGLDPGGSTTINSRLSSIDFRLLGGRLRLAASNAPGSYDGPMAGKVSATVDAPLALWRAHEVLGARELVGFMLGSITPRAMLHLFTLAQMPYPPLDN